MSRPVLLDLFSCAGGAGMGYHRAGFEVIGVDKDSQPRYPFEHHVADAIEVLDTLVRTGQVFGRTIDAVHTSPPCQSFTAYRRRGAGVGEGYLNLIPDVRERLGRLDVPWIIENVETARAELVDPVKLCGSSFGLDVRRHRLFESNIALGAPPCDHSWQTPRFPPATNRTNLRSTVEVGVWRIPLEVQRKAMGIDWMELRELSEALPPAFTEHLGRQLASEVTAIV
ncbi:DNA cytosine methyltransferase [Microbacterium sp. NPDC055599]